MKKFEFWMCLVIPRVPLFSCVLALWYRSRSAKRRLAVSGRMGLFFFASCFLLLMVANGLAFQWSLVGDQHRWYRTTSGSTPKNSSLQRSSPSPSSSSSFSSSSFCYAGMADNGANASSPPGGRRRTTASTITSVRLNHKILIVWKVLQESMHSSGMDEEQEGAKTLCGAKSCFRNTEVP